MLMVLRGGKESVWERIGKVKREDLAVNLPLLPSRYWQRDQPFPACMCLSIRARSSYLAVDASELVLARLWRV